MWEEHLFKLCGLLKITVREVPSELSVVLCCAILCHVQGVTSLLWSEEGELYKPAVCARAGQVVFVQPSQMKCVLQMCHRIRTCSCSRPGRT